LIPFGWGRAYTRPGGSLVLLLAGHPDGEAARQGHHVEEDVEALAVPVREGHPDLRPFRVLALALADAVGDVTRLLRGLAGFRVRVRHVLSPLLARPRPSRPSWDRAQIRL